MDGRAPSLLSRLVQGLLLWLFRRQKWTLQGSAPEVPKYVIAGAPHTTNWDFVFFVGTTHELGISPSFMGKKSLFRWPLRRFMFDLGGVPVDRSKRGNYVESIAAEFARRNALALVVAPEGTRSSNGQWRSGFYHIAMRAGVPIVPAWVDHRRKMGGLGAPITLTGDFKADMQKITAFFESMMPGHPRWANMVADDA